MIVAKRTSLKRAMRYLRAHHPHPGKGRIFPAHIPRRFFSRDGFPHFGFVDDYDSVVFFGQLTGNMKCVIWTRVDDDDCFPILKRLFLQRLNALSKITTIVVGRMMIEKKGLEEFSADCLFVIFFSMLCWYGRGRQQLHSTPHRLRMQWIISADYAFAFDRKNIVVEQCVISIPGIANREDAGVISIREGDGFRLLRIVGIIDTQ